MFFEMASDGAFSTSKVVVPRRVAEEAAGAAVESVLGLLSLFDITPGGAGLDMALQGGAGIRLAKRTAIINIARSIFRRSEKRCLLLIDEGTPGFVLLC